MATIEIQKALTLINGNKVSVHKMSEFCNVASRFDVITISGLSNPSKKEKYESMLIALGFALSNVEYCENAGFEGSNSDVLNYRITYKK